MFYWLLKHLIAGPALRSAFRPWVKGVENVPKRGAVIFASNHLSVVDSVFLPLVVPRRVTFLAKKEYFTGKGVKGMLTREFFKATGMLPIDRSGGAKSADSLQTGLEIINAGNALGIYPEGTRSADGRLYRGRTGIARMILAAKVPVTVVPVVMVDTEDVLPIGAKVPKIHKVGVVLGEPLDFSRYAGTSANDRFVMRAITDEIMCAIADTSEQTFRDIYASSVRNKLAQQQAEQRQSGRAQAA